MSLPAYRVRQKESNLQRCPQYEEEDINELFDQVLNGEISVSTLPIPIQSKLMIPLSIAKTEALVGGKIDQAHSLQAIIQSIYNSTMKSYKMDPSKDSERERFTEKSITSPSKLPFISTYKNPNSPEEKSIKFETELQASEEYWKCEMQHFNELRGTDFKHLQNRHNTEIQRMSYIPKIKTDFRPSSAFLSLKDKEATLRKKKKYADAEKMRDRAENVEFIQNQEKIEREEKLMKTRVNILKEKQAFETLTLEREWDSKLAKLKSEMNNEFRQKRNLIRSVRPKNDRMSRSMPVSKLSLPSLT